MIIAIDGPAGSGKSTIAREVANTYKFSKLDTGAMYRSVAWAAHDRGIDLDSTEAITHLAQSIDISFSDNADGSISVYVDGMDVSQAIRTPEIDRTVSIVAANPGVRKAMLKPQRQFAHGRDVVAEGRDIGSVVFPDAEIKIFLSADPKERARRRVLQRHEQDDLSPETLEAEIESTYNDILQRDMRDSQRETAPLICTDDAVEINSTDLSIDEIVKTIGSLIAERR